MREVVCCRLQKSDATRWATYLGAKIHESLLEGVLLEKNAKYDYWIQQYEQEVHSTPAWALTNEQLRDQLSGALEVCTIRFPTGLRAVRLIY